MLSEHERSWEYRCAMPHLSSIVNIGPSPAVSDQAPGIGRGRFAALPAHLAAAG